MKWAILAFLFTILGADISYAGGNIVDFSWQQAPNSTWGTKIYVGTTSGTYANSVDAGVNTTAYQLENLQHNTTYYFTATHYDPNGYESIYADEVTYTTPDVPGIAFNPLPVIQDSGVKTYKIILNIPN